MSHGSSEMKLAGFVVAELLMGCPPHGSAVKDKKE
jgi:hypothetical protein